MLAEDLSAAKYLTNIEFRSRKVYKSKNALSCSDCTRMHRSHHASETWPSSLQVSDLCSKQHLKMLCGFRLSLPPSYYFDKSTAKNDKKALSTRINGHNYELSYTEMLAMDAQERPATFLRASHAASPNIEQMGPTSNRGPSIRRGALEPGYNDRGTQGGRTRATPQSITGKMALRPLFPL